jgi:protein FrlC
MELGIFTSGYQRYPLERAFADARRFGYDYVELWGGRPHAYAPDLKTGEIGEVTALIKRYDMPVRVYTPEHNAYPYNYMTGSERQRRDALDYLKLAIEMGRAMGAEYTLISAGHAGYDAAPRDVRKRLLDSLGELAAHARNLRHTLLLEPLTPYESNSCNRAGDLSEILCALDSDHLYGMCDIVPPFVAYEPVMEYWDKLGQKMRHLHLVDSDGTSDAHLMPGDGRFPLAELLEELAARGYAGRATIELVTSYMNEPSLYARRAIDRVRALMPSAWRKV